MVYFLALLLVFSVSGALGGFIGFWEKPETLDDPYAVAAVGVNLLAALVASVALFGLPG